MASGDVPDISGKNDNCIKATADYTQSNLLYQTVDVLVLADPLYSTNAADNIIIMDVDSATVFPTSSGTDTPPPTTLQGSTEAQNISLLAGG